MYLLIFKKGIVAVQSIVTFDQAIDTHVPSVAPLWLHRSDETGHYLTHVGNADRPYQAQVQTHGRKPSLAEASDGPSSIGDTAYLYQNGPDVPGSAGEGGSNLETSPGHCQGS